MSDIKKNFPEPFKFCEYYIEEFLKETNYKRVNMVGFHNTLTKLRDAIKENFQEVNYLTYDIEYHGWHGEAAKNMHEIENALVKRLLEIYVICQMGLGEDVYEDSIKNESNK